MINKNKLKEKVLFIKEEAGSHSPSITTLLDQIPELKVDIDACFLSNPYATDLFMSYLNKILNTPKFRHILEYYPPQNFEIRKKISKVIDINPENIFVGNGAIEVIQACLHQFESKKLALPIPTFSSYYEFIKDDSQVFKFNLDPDNDYNLNISEFSRYIKEVKADSCVIINPNNPVGNYLSKKEIKLFLDLNTHLNFIILDESFLHFAFENSEFDLIDNSSLVSKYPNLIIIKSMSKDFGIAGMRAGYGVMNQKRVNALLSNGYLWNVSGLTNYFFELYSDEIFQVEYQKVRKKYIEDTDIFSKNLNTISEIKVYPSKANFALIKLPENITSFDFFMEILIDSNIYLRDCSDKIGLKGNYVRVASRTKEENNKIFMSFKNFFSNK